mmetsp:Transcript_32468/g.47696  ORF Transcript_32468/g.47696 Transcript_32468/m.47696 type:complete len:263 (-) Transcript_32468:29-817(-)|eukprot:CAMPEP_0195525304 /NCGR_PEP_ID=MMETSP0794_2-20130614/25699_1 /TAXON_ID=515487 /ORGANISM="Stephanopyxis turris, Strain CCMP 815" /LENGTH=262 /DNA_ID=CAMNT_0040655741 /DNA_START=49 /DNA_END=837 /DNA_ORIENTATION=+
MKVLVYADEGVSPLCLQETLQTFRDEKILLQQDITVTTIDHKQLIHDSWEEDTRLLVFPGGRDIPYDRRLRGEGTAKIRNFVQSGGKFLGICAGAYFASKEVIFEKDTPMQVHETRDLEFFPGAAIGTIYSNLQFVYGSETGAHASEISTTTTTKATKEKEKSENLHVYYNGGCVFHQAESFPSVTVLSRYQDVENQPPAIINCKVGQGNAILSGVHFEVSPQSLLWEEKGEGGGCRAEIIEKLAASNSRRKSFILLLMNHL